MKGERGENNPTRDDLDMYINENPACTFKLICSAFRMNPGTLRYHLDILERECRIKRSRQGRANIYYPDYLTRFRMMGSKERDLRIDHGRVMKLVSANPGIGRKEILSRLDISRADLSKALSDLKARGMICETGDSHDPGYEPVSRKKIAGEIMAILVNKVLDGEMNMDMFRSIRTRIERELSLEEEKGKDC